MVNLDIISDPICPWCFIGKTNLERALESKLNLIFNIRWHPFQLNPEMPEQGMERRTYLETKFGGKEAAVKAYAPVVEHAEMAGLTLNLEAISHTPNTLDAHRLIHWAGVEEKQNAVVDALFEAYFQNGRNIGDSEVLADIADSCGMDAAVVLKLLNSEADKEETRARDASARDMGVNSVPTFIVAGQHAVPGAQPAALWTQVIAELQENISFEATT
ncbi:MAG: DsbA family oxidoreductase [Rhodobacteraceae bacterium]|nr:DsbA family oxidoreductase [Paracoccaceae bacterium]MBL6676975.1 DsbA family oxidoreductase [Paracoccaceae bacterium]MBL6789626.1 DsbA family oxidoreductase [Paracoccaceae bacterium]MBL6859828.1 DsbA family oxidoreductase [Paracoccaceae bacterium]